MTESIRTGPACRLGEGLFVADGVVTWLDILAQQIYRYEAGRVVSRDPGIEATVVLAAAGSRVLLGSREGPAWFDFASGELAAAAGLTDVRLPGGFRSNDGVRLTSGDVLLGVMHRDEPEAYPGTVLWIGPDGTARDLGEPIHIPNTFVELDDGRILITDSAKQCVYRYRFDAASGLYDRAVWYQHAGEGTPDGGCRLPDGRIAISLWDEARVALFTPDGAPLGSLPVPARRPTNCKVDEGRDVIWVTSATEGLGTDRLSDLPYSGYTFGLSLP